MAGKGAASFGRGRRGRHRVLDVTGGMDRLQFCLQLGEQADPAGVAHPTRHPGQAAVPYRRDGPMRRRRSRVGRPQADLGGGRACIATSGRWPRKSASDHPHLRQGGNGPDRRGSPSNDTDRSSGWLGTGPYRLGRAGGGGTEFWASAKCRSRMSPGGYHGRSWGRRPKVGDPMEPWRPQHTVGKLRSSPFR